jgi:outer membrane lipoprotein-sorting protein
MMNRLWKYQALLFICFVLISAALPAETGEEVLRRIDKTMMPASYEAYRKIIDEYPDGKKKEFQVYLIKKDQDKTAMLFLSPASEKGRSTLRLGDNMWLYIPNVGKPVRITSLQSVTGGVFNNSDIMQVDYSTEYSVADMELTPEGYLLSLKAKSKTVAYDQLKMWATKSGIITKIECYSASGMLIKTIEFKDIKDFGNGIIRPAVMETYSPLYKGYRSSMIFTEIKRREFKDEVFTLNYMSRIEALRK